MTDPRASSAMPPPPPPGAAPPAGTAPPAGAARPLELCRRCKRDFARGEADDACRFHAGTHAGVTQQRWATPGDHVGGGTVHYFWSCCGAADRAAPGCKTAPHLAYGDPEPVLEC